MNAFLLKGHFFDLVKNKKICFWLFGCDAETGSAGLGGYSSWRGFRKFYMESMYSYIVYFFFISRNLELITYYSELKKHSYNHLKGIISFYCKEWLDGDVLLN